MGLRIVKITTYYKDFLFDYYQKYPSIINSSYREQYAHLMKERFAWSDAYANAFNQLGYDAYEIVANAFPLQKKWCSENNLRYGNIKENVIHQLQLMRPEIIWFQDSYTFNGEFIDHIRKIVPTIKLVIGNCCSPISKHYYQLFKSFDLITVCAPYFKKLLESNHLPECIIIPHAFDNRILNEINPTVNFKNDLLFTGSIILDQKFHNERINFLELLIKSGININLPINLNQSSSKCIHIKQIVFLITRLLKIIKCDSLNQKIEILKKVSMLEYYPTPSKISKTIKKQIQPSVFGLKMFEEILASKITFNIHGDIAANFAANMRMYEVTGMGSCLLTDWKPDIAKYFIPDEEIVTYKTFDEAKEKIDWLLRNPNEMLRIASKGQKRTLSDHTFLNRATKLSEVIQSRI